MAGVGNLLAIEDYTTEDFKLFFQSLQYLIQIEEK